MRGYRFDTEQLAIDAIQQANAHWGIPVSPEASTQSAADYFPNDNFFIIPACPEMVPILGEATEIFTGLTSS